MRPLERLERFVHRAIELQNSRLLSSGFRNTFSINWEQMQGLRFLSEQPDEDFLRSFLMTFRQFWMQHEPVHFPSVHNILHRALTSDELRGQIVISREHWTRAMRQGPWRYVVNGEPILPETVLDLWINGHYFHNDDEKRSRLRALTSHLDRGILARHRFLDALVDGTQQVLFLSRVIQVARHEGLLRFP